MSGIRLSEDDTVQIKNSDHRLREKGWLSFLYARLSQFSNCLRECFLSILALVVSRSN